MNDNKKEPTIPQLIAEIRKMAPGGDIDLEYGKLMEGLYISAANGEILTYGELTARYDKLNEEYKAALKASSLDERELDPLFLENTKSSQEAGESLKDYAYRMCAVINMIEFDGVEFRLSEEG